MMIGTFSRLQGQKRFGRSLSCVILLFILGCTAITSIQTVAIYNRYFTHIDDIGVAITLMKTDRSALEERERQCEEKFRQFVERSRIAMLSAHTAALCSGVIKLSRIAAVPLFWTYAPFQFFFTQALLDGRFTSSYQDIKSMGRLPSLLFSFLGIGALTLLLRRRFPLLGRTWFFPSLAAALVSFSLEQKILSAQMESYSIGVLSNVLIIYALFSLRDLDASTSYGKIARMALLAAMGIFMTYQGLFLFFAGTAAIAYTMLRGGKFSHFQSIKKYLALLFFSFVFGVLTYLPFFLKTLLARGVGSAVSWNAGPDGEFLVERNLPAGEKLVEFVRLLWNEAIYNAYSIVSGVEAGNKWGIVVVGACAVITTVLGLVFCYRRKGHEFFRFLLRLAIIYALTIGALIYTGRFPFAPTRHLLYFLPLVTILFCYGSLALLRMGLHKRILQVVLLIYFVVSIVNFGRFAAPRMDRVDEMELLSIVRSTSAVSLIYDMWDREPILMKDLESMSYRIGDTSACALLQRMTTYGGQPLVWFSHRRPMDAEVMGEISAFIKELLEVCPGAPKRRGGSIRVSQSGNLLYESSNVEVDLSNRTKNGANQVFVQRFDVFL